MPLAQPGCRVAAMQGELPGAVRPDPEADQRARHGCAVLPARDHQAVPRLDQGDLQIGPLPDDRQGRQPELHPGDRRCGVPLMRTRDLSLRDLGLLLTFGVALAATSPATHGQAAAPPAPARDDIVNALNRFETGPELDLPAQAAPPPGHAWPGSSP